MGNLSKILNACRLVGFDSFKLGQTITNLPRFIRDVRAYRQASINGPFPLRIRGLKPILLDYGGQAGEASGHYFFQDLSASRKIFKARPSRHLYSRAELE